MNNSSVLFSDSDSSFRSSNQATFNTTAIDKATFTTYNDDEEDSDQECFLVSSISSPLKSHRSTDTSTNEHQSILPTISQLSLEPTKKSSVILVGSSSSECDLKSESTKHPSSSESEIIATAHTNIVNSNTQILASSSSSFELESSSSYKSISSIPRTATDAPLDYISQMISSDENTEQNEQQPSSISCRRRSERLKSLLDQFEGSSEPDERHSAVTPAKQHICTVALSRLNLDSHTKERQQDTSDTEPKTRKSTRDRKISSNSDAGSNSAGPSPRKLRLRTPSTKCLEGFNLEDLHLSPTERRSPRKSIKSKRYTEHLAEVEKRRSLYYRSRTINEENQNVQDDFDDHDEDMEILKKSTILYDQYADVAGQNLFSFRTPKKRDGMALLAATAPTPKTPQTPKMSLRKSIVAGKLGTPRTPKSSIKDKQRASVVATAKTPRSCRLKMKQRM